MQKHQLIHLKNGLRVLLLPYGGIDTVALCLSGLAGSNYETSDEYGVAHLLEHTVFLGTKNYPKPADLEGLIDQVGGYTNAGTSNRYVNYFTRLLKEDLEKGLEFLSELFINPLLKEKDVLKEREVVLQEAQVSLDQPVTKFFY